MISIRSSMILAAALLGGCTSADTFDGQRTVFNNPFVPPEIGMRGIGPKCDADFGRDATCLGTPLIFDGRGRHVLLSDGTTIRLTRAQARILRERAELVETETLRNQPLPVSPSPPPVLPTAGESRKP